MEDVLFKLNSKGRGAFYIMDSADQLGEMEISIVNNLLTVYHTEVATKAEGLGLAKKMLLAMVDHARQHHLKVVPLCPFVHAQFKRNPAAYADIWQKTEGEE